MDGVNYNVNFKGGITDPSEIQEHRGRGPKVETPVYLARRGDYFQRSRACDDSIRVFRSLENRAIKRLRLSYTNNPAAPSMPLRMAGQKQSSRTYKRRHFPDSMCTSRPPLTKGAQVTKQLGDLSKTGFYTVAAGHHHTSYHYWLERVACSSARYSAFHFSLRSSVSILAGNSVNFISLFALILAVGILVDSGIVVTEAIHARMKIFPTATEAAKAALHDYAGRSSPAPWPPSRVFAPLFFISGIVGKCHRLEFRTL